MTRAACYSIGVVLMAWAGSAAGATLNVNVGGAGGAYASVQDAIDAANPGDAIEVAPGTYYEAINFNGKAVRLYSSGGPSVTFLDGADYYRVVQCVSGEGADTILEGFTISSGCAELYIWGGGMLNVDSSPTVVDCVFSVNSGSGMGNYGGSPTVSDCTFAGNLGDYGGGMYNFRSEPAVEGCAFIGNSAFSGAGLSNEYGNATVTDCVFSGNEGYLGAGVFNVSGNPTVAGCVFAGNVALWGGGVANWYGAVAVVNCIFSGNEADGYGGGTLNYGGDVVVTNSTFIGNAALAGGALCDYYGLSAMVANCIFRSNSPDQIFGEVAVSYSNVQGGWLGAGNIDADPLFVNAGSGDFRLLGDSPCIDAGNDAAVPAWLTIDLDGNPRIRGEAVDMGAYELQPSDPPELIANLIEEVVGLKLLPGLDKPLDTALKTLSDGNVHNDVAAVNALRAFINKVQAQRGKKIPTAQADAWIEAAREIIDLL